MVAIIYILVGLITSLIGSLAGLGGGAILIPTLLLFSAYSAQFSWVTPQTAVGLSLVMMIFTALASTISYFKQGRVDDKTGLLFLGGSIPGSMFGAWLNQFFKTDHFSLYFGILMIMISLLFFLKRERKETVPSPSQSIRTFTVNDQVYRYHVNKMLAIVISFFVGMVSGLFGIGGGSIMVPVMILIFSMPAHVATATSMFMIFFTSAIGASTYVVLGHIPWQEVLFFLPGAWIGGKLGARISHHLTGKALEWVLRIIIIFIGIRLIFDGLS